MVLASPRAGGAGPPCATLRGVRRAASPRALGLAFGRAVSGAPSGDNATAASYLHALLATCGDALDAVFVPPPGAAPGPLEGYLAALLAGGELARAAAAADAAAPPVPLLVLEDDVALAKAFEPALRAAGVSRFVLSLYNGHLPPLARGSAAALAARASRRNAVTARCAPLRRLLRRCGTTLPAVPPLDARLGAGLLRGGWGWGTQALLFSHAGDAAAYFADPAYVGLQDLLLYEFLFHPQAAAALACGWQPASSGGACGDGAQAMQPPPAVYGLDVSLVQHTGAASTLFGATAAANSRFHAAADFLDDIKADIRADAATLKTTADSDARSSGIADATRVAPLVQTLRWPAAVTSAAECARAALIVPCCAGASGFAPPGAPLSAAALPAAVAAAPRPSLFDAAKTDALITFRLSGVPCPRFGCCTAPLALRAGARAAAEDAATLARLLGGESPVLPGLLRRLHTQPATALLARARSGVALALLAHAWPGVRLVAVEPEAHAFAALQRNAYGIANVTALRAQTQLGAGARGFDFVWLDDVAATTLRDALAAGWLAAARAIAVELRADEDAAVVLRGALPRRDWAHARLGTPSRQLHVFTRRVAHAVAEAQ